MVGLLVCSIPIFSLLFMGGAFDYLKVVNSAQALVYYSLGLSCVALTRVLAPAFYALEDTKTPVITAFIAFLLNLCFSLVLMGPLKHGGLALATTLSATANMLLLLWFLRRKLGSISGSSVMKSAVKAVMASLPMALLAWYACSFIDWSQAGHKVEKMLVLGTVIMISAVLYLLAARLLRAEEIVAALALLQKKMGKR
jgi:putative peptidoglycan lipid II flippase